MSSVGILAWKSALAGGAPFAMPDFRSETARAALENDHWSPWPQDAAPGQPPPSIRGIIEPSPEALTHARQIWTQVGYNDTDAPTTSPAAKERREKK